MFYKNQWTINSNTPLILKLFFNGKDGFGGHWEDHEYLVAGLWVWASNSHVLHSKSFSVCLVSNAHG